jgi:hypothetical protein
MCAQIYYILYMIEVFIVDTICILNDSTCEMYYLVSNVNSSIYHRDGAIIKVVILFK